MMRVLFMLAALVALGSCQMNLAEIIARMQQEQQANFLDFCGMCETGVDKLKSTLLKNETVEQLEQAIEGQLCFGNAACATRVRQIADDFEEASAAEICSTLHLCRKTAMFPFTGARFCHLCERATGWYLDRFLNNATLSQVENIMEQACKGNSQCLDSVQKTIAELESVTPELICQRMHLCQASTATEVLLATDKCDACKQKLSDVFSDENMQKIGDTLKKLCRGNEFCTQKVDEIVQLFSGHRDEVVENVCKFARQC